MNRPKFLHPHGESRHARRHRRRGAAHAPASIPSVASPARVPAPLAPASEPAPQPAGEPHAFSRALNNEIQRAQAAGGPIDHASYSCACGYLFSADVSTSVTCPHCGTGQAW